MRIMRYVLCLFIILSIILSVFSFSVYAEDDFYWKEHDKAYITFVFDDGQDNIDFTQQMFDLFYNYGYPMCCAIVSSKAVYKETVVDLLRNIEMYGGEIMSHCYNHIPITSENSTIPNIEHQFGTSYKMLTKLGFKINGIIETGNGGGEATANYELMEPIVRKYYKYSNAYGTSIQYKGTSFGSVRHWLNDYSPALIERRIDKAVANKEWIMISAHSFKEYSFENFERLLTYIRDIGTDKIEVVTWNYMYENFGVYSGPQIPTQEVLDQIEYEKEVENNLNSNSSSVESSSTSSKYNSSKEVSTEEILIDIDDSEFSNIKTESNVESLDTNSTYDNNSSSKTSHLSTINSETNSKNDLYVSSKNNSQLSSHSNSKINSNTNSKNDLDVSSKVSSFSNSKTNSKLNSKSSSKFNSKLESKLGLETEITQSKTNSSKKSNSSKKVSLNSYIIDESTDDSIEFSSDDIKPELQSQPINIENVSSSKTDKTSKEEHDTDIQEETNEFESDEVVEYVESEESEDYNESDDSLLNAISSKNSVSQSNVKNKLPVTAIIGIIVISFAVLSIIAVVVIIKIKK